MEFIAFWEHYHKDSAKVIEKLKDRSRVKLKTLMGPYNIGGQTKGFTIFEPDDMPRSH